MTDKVMTYGERITQLDMECVHLRRKLDEAEQRVKWAREHSGLTDKERRILDMWPRFEDTGEPVMVGDEVDTHNHGQSSSVTSVKVTDGGSYVYYRWCGKDDGAGVNGERVKRPEPEVLDADGVPIEVGDVLYGIGRTGHEFKVLNLHDVDEGLGDAFSVKCYDMDDDEKCHCRPELLTHRKPDSWEKLWMDMWPECEDDGVGLDKDEFIRRAKALAGVE